MSRAVPARPRGIWATIASLAFGWLVHLSLPLGVGVGVVWDLLSGRRDRASLRRRIEVFARDKQEALLTTDPGLLIAVTGDRPADLGDAPFVPAEGTARLADLIVERVGRPADPPHVVLKVDGRKVPIKFFVRNIIDQTVRGLVSALKGGENAKKIELVLDRPDRDKSD